MKHLLKLSFLLLVFMLPNTATAYEIEVDGIYYNIINDNELEVTYYDIDGYVANNYSEYLSIPSTVNYFGTSYTVTAIGKQAFSGSINLSGVSIPNTVTSIGRRAFESCIGLYSITVPGSVSSIEEYAFKECSELLFIDIPNSVTSIGEGAFDDTEWYRIQQSGLIYAGSVAYKYKGTASGYIYIDYGTVGIAGGAFRGCSDLYGIEIPGTVTNIGNGAFSGCSGLTSVELPNSVTTIGEGSFSGCTGLTSIDIPNSVTTIGEEAFIGCAALTSVDMGNSVECIGPFAFDECPALTRVNITDLEAWCRICFSEGQSNPCSYAHHLFLKGEEITDLTIPYSISEIQFCAFDGCSFITNLTIPSSVTSIGTFAFQNCNGLTSVTIPGTVRSIYYGAFMFCNGLKDVYSHIVDLTQLDEMGDNVFYLYSDDYADRTLHVPEGSLLAYQSDTRWSQFFGSIVEEGQFLATSVQLNMSSAEVIVGQSLQLTATVLPEEASYKMVKWTSSDESVASVDENGLVTALSVGTATITATTIDGSNLSASCQVKVNANIGDTGDVNCDGVVDISDVTALIDYLLNAK